MIRKYLLTVMLIFAVTAGAWAQGQDNIWIRRYSGRIQANSYEIWGPFTMPNGWYVFMVEGDGDTDLVLDVYERSKNCYSCSWSPFCNCSSDPEAQLYVSSDKEYKLKVINTGLVYNDYILELKGIIERQTSNESQKPSNTTLSTD